MFIFNSAKQYFYQFNSNIICSVINAGRNHTLCRHESLIELAVVHLRDPVGVQVQERFGDIDMSFRNG